MSIDTQTQARNHGPIYLSVVKHSFNGQTILLPVEDSRQYVAHFKKYNDEYEPRDRTEEFLVTSLAELSWTCQKMRGHVANLMTEPGFAVRHAREINQLGVCEQRKARLFNETLKELERVRTKTRKK